MPAFPCSASAIITSAAPARPRRCWRWSSLLRDAGEAPIVLSRGYGGKLRGPIKVDPERHAAGDVGDEPLMMARTVAVVVARDRAEGVALARSQGASVILMDDGFQNPAIAKDASLIVIDGDRGLGNALRVSRRPPACAAAAATRPHRCADHRRQWHRRRRRRSRHRRAGRVGAACASRCRTRLRSRRCAASACWRSRASAIPPGFSGRCAPSGVEVVAEKAFADHHPFSDSEIEALAAAAKRDGLTLVTTEKDLARLRVGGTLAPAARDIVPFAVTLRFDDEAGIAAIRDRPAV